MSGELGGLRRTDPGRPRPYRLPAAGVLSPLAFIFANLLVYFAGFSTVFWLEVLIVLGFIAFAVGPSAARCPTSASARPWSRWRPRRPSSWTSRWSEARAPPRSL